MSHTDGPVTLLVVDDEEPIRNAVQKYLLKQGYDLSLIHEVVRETCDESST